MFNNLIKSCEFANLAKFSFRGYVTKVNLKLSVNGTVLSNCYNIVEINLAFEKYRN